MNNKIFNATLFNNCSISISYIFLRIYTLDPILNELNTDSVKGRHSYLHGENHAIKRDKLLRTVCMRIVNKDGIVQS